MTYSLRIIVTGLIGQHWQLGGITWHYLNYLIGLSKLGHDVYYFEDSGEWPYKLDGSIGFDASLTNCDQNVRYLNRLLTRYGLKDKWSYFFPIKSEFYGLEDNKRKDIVNSADLLINISGSLESPEKYNNIKNLVYIDTDPIFTQILALTDNRIKKRIDVHDKYFSFASNLPDEIPDLGYKWIHTLQPIALSEWENNLNSKRDVYSTVMNWTSYKPVTYSNKCYGQKDIEFNKFIELPCHVDPITLEVTIGNTIHTEWEDKNSNLNVKEILIKNGWTIVDSLKLTSDVDSYKKYIQSSKAEWSVAKNGYVVGKTGWFSERSACYLASGRPVILQDTGFSDYLPTGDGLFAFNNLEEAISAIREVENNYKKHSKAALEIANEFFSSDKVLTNLLNNI